MPQYDIVVDVEAASGFQVFRVTADNPEDALEVLKKGGAELVVEEVEVTDLADPDLSCVNLVTEEPDG